MISIFTHPTFLTRFETLPFQVKNNDKKLNMVTPIFQIKSKGINTSGFNSGNTMPLFGGGGISRPNKGLGMFVSLGSSLIPGASGILSAVKTIGSIFGGGHSDSQLVDGSIRDSKKNATGTPGSIDFYNSYLKNLYRWYTYQYKIKKRSEGSKIMDEINVVENALRQAGYNEIGTKTSRSLSGKRHFDYSYKVFAKSLGSQVKDLFSSTSQPVNNSMQTGSKVLKAGFSFVTLLIVAIPVGLYLLWKKFK